VIVTTLRSSSPEPITQSIAFLSAPGKLWPYSGDAIRTASLSASAWRQSRTEGGSPLASVSGSKCGSCRRPS
jgi:hypothetical protein